MRNALVIVFLVACSACSEGIRSHAQSSSSASASERAPEGWILYPPPATDSDALRCANYSMREWKVALSGETLQIQLDKLRDHQDPLPPQLKSRKIMVDTKGERHVIAVNDGWLVGLDFGEFGGALWWFSSDGTRSRKIAEENVVGFANSAQGVLVLGGLAHLGFDSGKVWQVRDGEAGEKKLELVADLGSTPRTFLMPSSDSLLILTTRGLVRLKTNGELQTLFTTHYQSLYPTSMTLSPSGVIYVGMRHFVTRLTPTGNSYREEWFVSASCSKFRIRDYDCICSSGNK
jgi:hypothetical protein